MSDSFCVLPWIQVSIKPSGAMTTCCVMRPLTKFAGRTNREKEIHEGMESGNIEYSRLWWENNNNLYICGKDSMFDVLNAPLLKEIRLSMLKGEKHPACQTCWSREEYSKGKISVRVRTNLRWKEKFDIATAKKITSSDGSIDPTNIKNIELRFGNHCNLKCVMCHPGHSDSWYSDWKKLSEMKSFWTQDGSDKDSFMFGGSLYKMNDPTPFRWYKTKKFKEDFNKIYTNLVEIYWAGGEPLLCEDHLNILETLTNSGVSKNIRMRYDSNITYLPEKIIDHWKKFDWISVQGSIDDIGIRNEYIRYPSKWDKVSKNLKYLDSISPDLAHSGTTLSCYNILTFLEFPKWAKHNMSKHFWEVMHFKTVMAPFHLAPAILPKVVKVEAVKRIDSYLNSSGAPNKDTMHYIKIDMFKNYLIEKFDYFNEEFYKGFIQHTKNLDKIRPLQFKDCFPELYEMIKKDFDGLC